MSGDGRPPRVATYRVQLRPGFDFDAAAELAPYLAALGVSHLYASPLLEAAPGSEHGYDVVDPTRVRAELGGEEGRLRMVEALRRAGMGLLADVVPNHMATRAENPFWWDLLESGPWGEGARVFDVDWEAPEERVRGRVLVPVLGDHYGRVLEAGELTLEREAGVVRVRYHDHLLPLSPESTGRLLEAAGADDLAGVARAFADLPRSADPRERRRRGREVSALRERLAGLLSRRADLADAVDRHLAAVSSDPDALDAVLEAQHHRLAYWRAGARDLDYRRFFDIDGLAGVRVEDPWVFDLTHRRVLSWWDEGTVDGLRIDHPDGLRSPRAYLERLRERTPGAWLVVEKILEGEEELRSSWPVEGTTGYEALADVTALFVDPEGEGPLTDLFVRVTGGSAEWERVVHARKHQILEDVLAADVNRLTHLFVDVCEEHRRFRDFTRWELRETLREALACFPVYRTYVEEDGAADDEDRRVVRRALDAARGYRPDLDPELFDLLGAVLLGRLPGPATADLRMRVQQATGPVTAKAVEDTAFYAWPRFVALHEVGSSPHRFGLEPEAFHARCRRRAEAWAEGLTALSTHDTKRSEDVRARLSLLSEIPERWEGAVAEWREMNVRHRAGPSLPGGSAEYLLYQTLVGAHPLGVERAVRYMEKASREAKSRTSWTDPVPEYDRALRAFVEGALEDGTFRESLEAFVAPLVEPGRTVSLAQKLVQVTMPGVPDVYQGTELWDLSLVDPDNRRPVDFGRRRRMLDEVRGWLAGAGEDGPWPFVERIRARSDEGLPKLWVLRRALELRARRPEAFGPGGDYRAVRAAGARERHVVAFRRGEEAVTVVPRLVMSLEEGGGWGDTRLALPPGTWRDVLTGVRRAGEVALADLLADFPVSLLAREGP